MLIYLFAHQHESEKARVLSIRRIVPTDIENVVQLDMLAFAAYLRQTGYSGPVHPRTQGNILACLNLNPYGCFVAEAEKLVGYIFTHILGAIGWIGTFGVHPDYQGQGIGRSLLNAAVEYLQGASCMTIGLETMSDSPYNVGFYSRFGFLPIFPTALLVKKTGPEAKVSPYTMLGQLEHEVALPAITQICQAAYPGLDYAAEVSNAREYGWGETLLIGWPKPWAFSLIRTIPKGEGTAEPVADVEALVIHPGAGRNLGKALQTVEAFALNQGFMHVNLAVNTIDGEALRQVLGYGFRVNRIVIRMVFNGEYNHPVGKILNKWLM